MDNYLTEYNEDIIPRAQRLLSNSQVHSDFLNNSTFLPEYLAKNIGKWIKVEHLVGNNLISHIGQLISSGIDYIVLKLEGDTLATVVCNTKDIRFITVIYDRNTKNLK